MVGHAAGAVRPGGVLVYATCSSEPDENEEVVAAFLHAHADFEAVCPDRADPVAPGLRAVLDDRGRLSTTPFDHGLDAFFAVVLRRRGRPAGKRRLSPGAGRGGLVGRPAEPKATTGGSGGGRIRNDAGTQERGERRGAKRRGRPGS